MVKIEEINMTVGFFQRGNGRRRKFLLGRRKRESLFCPLIFNGAGGKFEEGEDANACMIREAWEEFGLTASMDPDSADHFATATFHYPKGNGDVKILTVYFFRIRKWEGEEKALDGFDMVKWFPVNKLPVDRMHADQEIWLNLALRGKPGHILQVTIFYEPDSHKKIKGGNFEFVPVNAGVTVNGQA